MTSREEPRIRARRKPELGQRGLVLGAKIDGDAGAGVVPNHAHRYRGRPLAPLKIHKIRRFTGKRWSRGSQRGEDAEDGGTGREDAIENFHANVRTTRESDALQVCAHGGESRKAQGKSSLRGTSPVLFGLNNNDFTCYLR